MNKILCTVEDDPDMRFLIRAILDIDPRLKIADEADNIDDALKMLTQQSPDLIILDHFIHGKIMGLNAAPLLREAAPNAKILLFTSHDLTAEATREEAIDSYLQKNDIDKLLPVILELLGLEEEEKTPSS